MVKTITFLELLKMMKKGNAPKRVIFDSLEWMLRENGRTTDYYNEIKSLSSYCGESIYLMEFVERECIFYEEPILTEKEKAYLSSVLKPFKNRVKEIIKYKIHPKHYIHINLDNGEAIALPYFAEEIYKGMEEDKSYTPSELGLWEEE